MGGSGSKPKVEEKKEEKKEEKDYEKEEEVPLGEGVYGKTYRKGKYVIKRFKYDVNDDDFMNEMKFYGWINTLKPDEQKHFCRLISYKIYFDTSFRHTAKNIDKFFGSYRKKLEDRNNSKWTVDLTLEYKGRKVSEANFNDLQPKEKYNMLLKLLHIVKILKINHVFHYDIRPNNLVIDDSTMTLALIDYGVTFFEGERSEETEAENEMLLQVAMLMVNHYALFPALDKAKEEDSRRRDFDEVTDFLPFLQSHEKTKDVLHYLTEFAKINKYPLTRYYTESKSTGITFKYDYAGDNLLRVSHPDLYLQLYNLKTSLPPPYFGLDDLKIVYDNWNDIDKIISLFESKARE